MRTAFRGTCPFCFAKIISATDPFGDHIPQQGDLALCGECHAFSVFNFANRRNLLRKPTTVEFQEILRNNNAQKLMMARGA